MRHHADDLFLGQRFKQPRGRGDCSIFRIAARGKRVRLRCVDHVHLGHRQVGMLGELAHHGHKLRGGAIIHLLRVVHAQHHFVGVPIAEQVHAGCNDEGDRHAACAADEKADPHEKGGEAGEKDTSAHNAH